MLKKMKSKKFLILVIVLIALGIYFYRSRSKTPEYTDTALDSRVVAKTVSASGVVKSINESSISFLGSGRVNNISVKKGDSVKKGSYLMQIDNTDTYQTSKAARDTRDVAIKDIEIYKKLYADNTDLVGGSTEYSLNITRLEELLSKADATYKATLFSLSNTSLYAPFDGTVVDIYYDLGETTSPASPAIKIADLSNLIFEVSLDQEDFGFVKIDQKVDITLDSYPDTTVRGVIYDLPYYADSSSTEFTVKIKLDQPSDSTSAVLLGMKGDADIIVEESEGSVPALLFDAIFEEDGKHFVWVLENDVLVKEYIEIGLEGDIYTEVKTDLSNKKIVVPKPVEN